MVNPDRSAATPPMWCSGSVLLEKHQCLLALLTWQVSLAFRPQDPDCRNSHSRHWFSTPFNHCKCANWVCRGTYMYWIGGRKIMGNKKIYPITYCHNERSQMSCFAVINSAYFAHQYANSKPVLMYAYCICLQSQNHSLLIIPF